MFIALGILICYVFGRSLEWNWLAMASCLFLVPFTFGLYFIPESPPWLVYNDEEDLAFKSMVLIRGEEYDATVEIRNGIQQFVLNADTIADKASNRTFANVAHTCSHFITKVKKAT